MRHLLSATALAALLALPAGADTLTIVHVNDLDRMEGSGDAGGVARLATVVNQVRAEGGTVIVTSGGDSISPSLFSGFDQGAHMIDLLNQVGLDAMVLGNHEFDFGPDVAEARIAEANFPVLSNNAMEEDGTLLDGVTEHLMIEVGDHTVGLFGLTTASTAVKSSPGPVTFRDPVEIAAEMAETLQGEGADMVIALAHTDLGEDAELYQDAPVDLILSGDDHDVRVQYDGRKALIESGSQAEFVTVITLDMATVEGRRGPEFTWEPSFRLVNTADVTPDETLAAAVAVYEAQLSEALDVTIGSTDVDLDTRRTTVRSTETGFANLIVDAMAWATEADVAITNGGGIRADRTYEAGTELTRRDVMSELPFGNKTILIEVSGDDIRAALENGVSEIEEGGGRFPHVAGMTFSFDASKPAGERVGDIMVGGAALDPAKTYRLATNDFMGKGGDGYAMFADKPRIVDANSGALMAAQVIRYIENAGTVAPEAEGRVTRLD
ncbi:MAG: 5'-nucleotidase C-terminal domain-containing protein [Pseudomonadota bacterium]